MSVRYYDNSTGLMHVHSREASYGFGSLDSKSVSCNPQGATSVSDSATNLHPFKLIKADFRCQVEGIRGRLLTGVIDVALDTVDFSEIDDFDEYEGFPIDIVSFISNNANMWNYRKVWKPDKYAQSGDMDMFMTINPSGFWSGLTVWSYAMSIHSIWKPL